MEKTVAEKPWAISGVLAIIVAVTVTCLMVGSRRALWKSSLLADPESLEPELFEKHSSFEQLSTHSGRFIYPKIRVFYHAHPQAAKLPKNLPLLVFMHGLGGNATQFSPLLEFLVHIAPCLAIDLPGCGLSDFKPDKLAAYSTGAFAELLSSAIEKYRDADNEQKVVLIGHSMGSSICALLASSTSPLAHLLTGVIIGFVALCPRSDSPTPKEVVTIKRLKWMHPRVFDLLRKIDRRGGTQSASVLRVVGEGADEESRKMQMRYNQQSKSSVFLRTLIATLPPANINERKSHIDWPGKVTWTGIKIPLLLVAGEADRLTPVENIQQVANWLSPKLSRDCFKTDSKLHVDIPQRQSETVSREGICLSEGERNHPNANIVEENMSMPSSPPLALHNDDMTAAPETKIFPTPAAHGLMYDSSTVHELARCIERFISHHVDERVSREWQVSCD